MKSLTKKTLITTAVTAVLIVGLVFANNVVKTMDSVIALESSITTGLTI